MAFENYADKVRKHFAFSPSELKGFLLVIIMFGFFWSFTQWGVAAFDALEGLKSWLISILIAGIAVFAHHSAQRLLGISKGYKIEHEAWLPGLLVGLLVLLLSNGRLIILAGTAMKAQLLSIHRIGLPRTGPNLRDIGFIALSGPLASIALAFVLTLLFPTKFFADLMSFAVWFGLINLIPLPPLDGINVLAGARTTRRGSFSYFFILGAFFGFLLVYYTAGIGIFWSAVLAVMIGIVTWLVLDIISK